ncbi:hypothetical protein [Rhodovulum sp. FJ3]|nr:hypothetical protein [Rhodovulum sp. FJ3]MDV4167712.1 hypothetical protein [Rhodovulum sp. FJ3]
MSQRLTMAGTCARHHAEPRAAMAGQGTWVGSDAVSLHPVEHGGADV